MDSLEKHINKIIGALIALLLAIIGFFLMATYNKINDTNVMVHKLQVELAAMREKESHFLNYKEVAQLIDKKIAAYHKENH